MTRALALILGALALQSPAASDPPPDQSDPPKPTLTSLGVTRTATLGTYCWTTRCVTAAPIPIPGPSLPITAGHDVLVDTELPARAVGYWFSDGLSAGPTGEPPASRGDARRADESGRRWLIPVASRALRAPELRLDVGYPNGVSSGVRVHEAGCPTRHAPAAPYPRARRARPIVVGCGRLSSGRAFQLVAYRQPRPRRAPFLCIDTLLLPRGPVTGCGDDHVRKQVEVSGVTSAGGKPTRLSGTTAPGVARVILLYRRPGRRAEGREADLVQVSRRLAQQAGGARRFGYYVVELPRGTRAVRVEAQDVRGRVIGTARP